MRFKRDLLKDDFTIGKLGDYHNLNKEFHGTTHVGTELTLFAAKLDLVGSLRELRIREVLPNNYILHVNAIALFNLYFSLGYLITKFKSNRSKFTCECCNQINDYGENSDYNVTSIILNKQYKHLLSNSEDMCK